MTTKPEEYRAQALHCRLMADQVKSPLDKELWLELAADWMAMAAIHERHGIGQPRAKPSRPCAFLRERMELPNFCCSQRRLAGHYADGMLARSD
jgi:hypothetical protein